MLKFFILFLFYFPLAFAEPKTIELISNFSIDSNSSMFENCDVQVIYSELSHLWENQSGRLDFFEKLFKKCSPNFIKTRNRLIKESIAKIVFFNFTCRFKRHVDLYELPPEKLVLFMWEPPIILSKMYKRSNEKYFSKIYTWDDELVDNQKYFKFYYPSLLKMSTDIPSFEEKKLCTLIASHFKSTKPNQLYEEREKTIEFFEKIGEEGFEFYGRWWNPLEHKSYRGIALDKVTTLKQYRFSICYENSKNLKGYITEKLFDCFAAGNVPVYWGASNVERYIPKNCFIDRQDFSKMEDLYHFLKTMNQQQYETYIQNIREWLQSDQAQLFSVEHFKKNFFESNLSLN